ncbi:MAG: hypothetical protein RLZZ573_456, partial [Pseudomonadota bacterium]
MQALFQRMALVALATWLTNAHADFYVVVSASNPQPALSKKAAIDL